jgi:hypothetical protein
MNKRALIYIILFNSLLTISAQEVVTGLFSDVKIRAAWEKDLNKRKGLLSADTLELPFFDDFSKITVYPDQKKWQDNYVYINNTYSQKQRTAGVATFDALDNSGRLYETASSEGFEADHLTSRPINLNYSASDNIFLSFYYEAGGLADMPEAKDSLTLQFFAPSEGKWYSIWKASGDTTTGFKAIIIPVVQTRYLKKGFQFRFINYASLSASTGDPAMLGNGDQWNLDYILLNKNRNNADTVLADVAFTLPVRTILNTYESMPWKQFRQVYLSEMGPWIYIHYQNNDKVIRNVTRNFEIWDEYKNSLAFSFTAGTTNIDPLAKVDFKATLLYTFYTNNNDSALFRVKSYITTDVFDPKDNDTLIYYQKFVNYFAFDDGSAEAGYGVNGLGSRNAMVAFRFRSLIPDTLRAIQISFNDSYLNANQRAFDLMIWGDNDGVPGETIYKQEDMIANPGQGISGFYSYILNDPQPINGTFYVGWKQRSETFLNAGFDLNTLHGGRQLYWLNGDWNISQAKGTLMIRPVFGSPAIISSVQNIKKGKTSFKIWPNPAVDYINIDAGDIFLQNEPNIKISDLQGRVLIETSFSNKIEISSLPEGIYFIMLNIKGKPIGYNRFIKNR